MRASTHVSRLRGQIASFFFRRCRTLVLKVAAAAFFFLLQHSPTRTIGLDTAGSNHNARYRGPCCARLSPLAPFSAGLFHFPAAFFFTEQGRPLIAAKYMPILWTRFLIGGPWRAGRRAVAKALGNTLERGGWAYVDLYQVRVVGVNRMYDCRMLSLPHDLAIVSHRRTSRVYDLWPSGYTKRLVVQTNPSLRLRSEKFPIIFAGARGLELGSGLGFDVKSRSGRQLSPRLECAIKRRHVANKIVRPQLALQTYWLILQSTISL